MTQRQTHPFAGARKMRPTQKHRPAIWECMLGTVYARNAAGEVRYFDYKWDDARAFAGVDLEGADPRLHRNPWACNAGNDTYIRKGQRVLWVRR